MKNPDVVKHIVMKAYLVINKPSRNSWDRLGNVLVYDTWYKCWVTKHQESSWANDYWFDHGRYTHWMVINDVPCYEID